MQPRQHHRALAGRVRLLFIGSKRFAFDPHLFQELHRVRVVFDVVLEVIALEITHLLPGFRIVELQSGEKFGAVHHFDVQRDSVSLEIVHQRIVSGCVRHHQRFRIQSVHEFRELLRHRLGAVDETEHAERLADAAAGDRAEGDSLLRGEFAETLRDRRSFRRVMVDEVEHVAGPGDLPLRSRFQFIGEFLHRFRSVPGLDDVAAQRELEADFVVAFSVVVTVAVATVRAGKIGAVERVDEIGVGQLFRMHPDRVGDQRPDARRIRLAAARLPHRRKMAAHEAEPAA